mgnify:CR=1 FL=1|tara:strand:+ start:11988 stop:15002 length:3015 start_codon:yes stop_codon:yes gene_type:complete
MNDYSNLYTVKTSNDYVQYDYDIKTFFGNSDVSGDKEVGDWQEHPPAVIEYLTDMSYIEFKPDHTRNSLKGIDLSQNIIDNAYFIHFGYDIIKYVKFKFYKNPHDCSYNNNDNLPYNDTNGGESNFTLSNIQFKDTIIGDISYILWKRLPIPENLYYSKPNIRYQVPYVIIGNGEPINTSTIYNQFGTRSYEYIFELVPPQRTPKNIIFNFNSSQDLYFEIFTTIQDIPLNKTTDLNNHGNSTPDNSIVFKKYGDISHSIFSDNDELFSDFKLNEYFNDPLLTYNNHNVITNTYNDTIIDVSSISTKYLYSTNAELPTFPDTDLSINILDISDISVNTLSLKNNNNILTNKLDLSTCNITESIDTTTCSVNTIDASCIYTNHLFSSSPEININLNDPSAGFINFINNNYHYLRFDFNNQSDISINNLKIYNDLGYDISFSVWDSSRNSNTYTKIDIYDTSFSKTYTDTSNVSLLIDLSENTFVSKFQYEREEKIFTIDNSNNSIAYSISNEDINISNNIFYITLPSGRWTIAEINTLLADHTKSFSDSKDSSGVIVLDQDGNIYDASGLKPRNTHFNKYLPFTAVDISGTPRLGTAFDYQIHNISDLIIPKVIYTYFDSSNSFLKDFFDASYLQVDDISGITPHQFLDANWNYNINNLIDDKNRPCLTKQTYDGDISRNVYQNVLFNLKYDKYSLYGICNKFSDDNGGGSLTIDDSSYGTVISQNIPYDYYTFKSDHYKPINAVDEDDVSYDQLNVDLSDNDPSYNISPDCIPLLDLSINDTTNINEKILFIEDKLVKDLSKNIYISQPFNTLIKKNNSDNLLSVYARDGSGLFIHISSDVSTNGVVYVNPAIDGDVCGNTLEYISVYINYLNIYGITTGILYNLSDDSIKHNEVDLSNALLTVKKIYPKIYYKTTQLYSPDHNFDINNIPSHANLESGYIAQDIANIPELNYLVDISNTPMNINYFGIQAYLTKAIQELHSKVLERETIIQNLKQRLEILKNY